VTGALVTVPGRVCVVGSFMMDLTVRTPRLPRAGETVMGSSFDIFLGGKGFNQAVAAARAGADTSMVGCVGDDDFGEHFLGGLRREGIDSTYVQRHAEAGTGIGMPIVDEAGENVIIVVPRANSRMSVADVEAATDVIEASATLLLQLELPVEAAVAAARIARRAGSRVVLNPAPALPSLEALAGLIDVLVPNAGEAALLLGDGDGAEPPEMAMALRSRFAADIVLTLGGDGALLADGRGVIGLAPHRVAVVDSVGAGDAFCGALGARLAWGDELRDAAAYANAAGALAVTRVGAEPSMPTSAEVDELLARRRAPAAFTDR
jgi:ribokinase